MVDLDAATCEDVGGGLNILSVVGQIYSVGSGLYRFTNALGATLRNYYGDDAALEAFRGGNLGA